MSLYTTRIVVSALGQSDYGLFGAVGGVVLMFTFMTGSLSNATSRFLSYAMGRGKRPDALMEDENYSPSLVFRTSWRIHLYMALCVVVIGAILAQYNWLNIPQERVYACQIVLYIVVFRTVISTLQIPLFALNIANERMDIYALVGLIDAFGNLIVALAIQQAEMDRLVLYAALGLIVNLVVFATLIISCRRFEEFQFRGEVNYILLRQMSKYTVWTLTASLGAALRSNGVVVLVQKYFGSVATAPVVISQKICNSINSFTQNFATASNPQIIKQWAAGNINESHQMVTMASRLTWALLTLLCLPLFLEADFVMQLWLKEECTPEAVLYTRIMLITCMIDAFSFSASAAIQATGHVAKYNFTCSGIIIISVPIAWGLYVMGYPVETAMWCVCGGTALAQIARIIFLRNLTGFRLRKYSSLVLFPCMVQLLIATSIPTALFIYLDKSIISSLLVLGVSDISAFVSGWPFIRPWFRK
ncbi:MAG: hypothetical protein Q4C30_09950 [Bacteroidia bacterium]|nr:hypothetical protein [Bacteroidia bacterium]